MMFSTDQERNRNRRHMDSWKNYGVTLEEKWQIISLGLNKITGTSKVKRRVGMLLRLLYNDKEVFICPEIHPGLYALQDSVC